MADVSPLVPQGRQVIESYGDRRFRISGTAHESSVVVTPDETRSWSASSFDEASAEDLIGLLEGQGVEILLLGCGPSARLPSRAMRTALRAAGMVVEPMDTGAACRTFNVLMAEERRVAAALIAVE